MLNDGTVPSNGLDTLITRRLIIDNPAFTHRDTVSNLEVVDVMSPDTGDWLIIVEGREITDDQSTISGTQAFPKQDYSLVFDIKAEPDDEFGGDDGGDDIGLIIRYNGQPLVRWTREGHIQTVGSQQSGAVSGLYLGSNAGIDTDGDLICDPLYQDQGTWLDNGANLTGLSIKNAEGDAVMHVSAGGEVRTRKKHISRLGGL